MKTTPKSPQLARVLILPLRLVPGRLHGALSVRLLERVFATQRVDGELDFMEGKGVRIRVPDTGIDLCLSAGANGFDPAPRSTPPIWSSKAWSMISCC